MLYAKAGHADIQCQIESVRVADQMAQPSFEILIPAELDTKRNQYRPCPLTRALLYRTWVVLQHHIVQSKREGPRCREPSPNTKI